MTTIEKVCPTCGCRTEWVPSSYDYESPDGRGLRAENILQLVSGTPCRCGEEEEARQAAVAKVAAETRAAARAVAEHPWRELETLRADDERVILDPLDQEYTISVSSLRKSHMEMCSPSDLPRYAADGSGIVFGPNCSVVPFCVEARTA